jgi:hypothetical protein
MGARALTISNAPAAALAKSSCPLGVVDTVPPADGRGFAEIHATTASAAAVTSRRRSPPAQLPPAAISLRAKSGALALDDRRRRERVAGQISAE